MAIIKEFYKVDKSVIEDKNQKQTKAFYIVDKGKKMFQINTIPDSQMSVPIEQIKSFSQTMLFDESGMKFLSEIIDSIISKSDSSIPKEAIEYSNLPLQQIFYGAPGTGKSYSIKKVIAKHENKTVDDVDLEADYIFRTTFHPDYDYAQFVGCYKPTKTSENYKSTESYDFEELVEKLKECIATNSVNVTNACTLFGFQYRNSIIQLLTKGEHNISDIVKEAYDGASSFDTEVRAGMNIYDNINKCYSSSNITYDFMPQVFTNALVKAYESKKHVYLVIEEINRGNCAQIFGDIFQLLDRNGNGESEYSISVDEDLRKYLETNCPESIKEGKIKLPANLSIIATMNTSDQSLFPMDSAFKRRWEWKYVPICQGKDKYGKFLEWKIETTAKNKSWWDFLRSINSVIASVTKSEDKELGFFFCKPNENNEISKETFVNKVVFYLWSDVFKTYGFRSDIFNKDAEGKEKLEFKDFYTSEGDPNEVSIDRFITNVMNHLTQDQKKEDGQPQVDEEKSTIDSTNE